MIEILTYTFMQKALLGGFLIAIIIGLIGPFLVLRRLSLLGDGIAHLSFGGIAIGILLGINPLLTTIIFSLVGAFFIQNSIKKNTLPDSAVAVILSFGLGLGIIVISIAKGFKTDLFSYLIGSILTLSNLDLIAISVVFILTIIFILINYKFLVFQSFNNELAELSRKNSNIINTIFTILITFAIIIGIKAVGILLITGLIVLPTLASLNISKSFKSTLIYSIIFSVLGIISGIIISYYLDIAPSGTIIFILLGIYLITFIKK